jgi:hypothetical protein
MLLRSALFIALFFAAALTPKIGANAGSPSGRALGQLGLAEKLGIDHADHVVDFDYSTGTFPFYVAPISLRWEIGLARARWFAGKRNSPVSDCVWHAAE